MDQSETSLADLLDEVSRCNACGLMAENRALGIPFVPGVPRPQARIMVMGRDPNPRSVESVGMRGGRSAFVREIYRLADEAGVPDDLIYVTNLLKCHWRTTSGRPLPRTEQRLPRVRMDWAQVCMDRWLLREIEILRPTLIVAFGEELYQMIRPRIVEPEPAPLRLSATVDKSVLDAELWFAQNGPLAVELAGERWPLAVLRHPGHSGRLKGGKAGDRRWAVYDKSVQRVVDLVRACQGTGGAGRPGTVPSSGRGRDLPEGWRSRPPRG